LRLTGHLNRLLRAVAVGGGLAVRLIVLLAQDFLQAFHFVPALQAERVEILGESVRELLALYLPK
jgi:hypothetical protein